ncbi:GNAT family N-acetyltransferase [Alkalibacillus sp. S2W]|uniref:GNAT family N-acetyltransferase n=1 Tax=Alkalibacillus sp. S2W TaxID=3386553 RepID=UPI00398D095C
MYLDQIEGFDVRKATKQDCDEVIKLLKVVALWLKNNEIDQWSFLLAGGDDEEIKQAIAHNDTYVVEWNEQIVATFTLLSEQSEWDVHIWGYDPDSNSLYLHRLAIIPSYMNNGLGKEILAWIENNTTDKTYLRLDCVADNKRLNDYYKNNHFEAVGLTDGHSQYQKFMKEA